VYVRLDRGLWDGAYSVDNANLVLTIVAVQQSHPLRAFLDSQQALCPIKQSRSGPTCDCELENFPVRPAPTLPHLSPHHGGGSGEPPGASCQQLHRRAD